MLNSEKEKFILNEILTLTINGALSTRKGKFRIYLDEVKAGNRRRVELNNYLRKNLLKVGQDYINEKVDGDVHLEKIIKFKDRITSEFSNILHNREFRIGIAQKLINLFLKYLWICGKIKEAPPHCR